MTFIVWASVVVAIALAVGYWTMTSLRRLRVCPACRSELNLLPASSNESPPRTYDIIYCRDCTHVATLVHNQRGRFAYCPACRQLSLRSMATCHGENRDIHVDEACEICGYSTERDLAVRESQAVSEPAPRLGKVIPFPGVRQTDPGEGTAEP